MLRKVSIVVFLLSILLVLVNFGVPAHADAPNLDHIRLPFTGRHTITEACAPPPLTNNGGSNGYHVKGASWAVDVSGSDKFYIGTNVYAAASGTITLHDDGASGYGKHIILLDNQGLTHYYAHLSQFVAGGGSVTQGELIALSGDTGNGPAHLHWHVQIGSDQNTAIPVDLRTVPGMNVNCDLPSKDENNNGISPGSAIWPPESQPAIDANPLSDTLGNNCPAHYAANPTKITLFDGQFCNGNSLPFDKPNLLLQAYSLELIGFDNRVRSIHVPDGWSLMVMGTSYWINQNSRCITGDMWNLDQDYYTTNPWVRIGWSNDGPHDPISVVIPFDNPNCLMDGKPILGVFNGGIAPQSISSGSFTRGVGGYNPNQQVKLYELANYGGTVTWSGGEGRSDSPDRKSFSMYIPSGWSVITHSDDNLGGGSRCWEGSVPNLQDHGWHLNIDSIEVYARHVCGQGVSEPEGVYLYRANGMGGDYCFLTQDAPSIGNYCKNAGYGDNWNDDPEYIRVVGPYQYSFFRDDNYGLGWPNLFTGNGTMTLHPDWDNELSSIRIRKTSPAIVKLYNLGDLNGQAFSTDRSVVDLDQWYFDYWNVKVNDNAQSAWVAPGYEAIFCLNAGYEDVCGRATGSVNNLDTVAPNLRNNVSSIFICTGSCPPAPLAPNPISPGNSVSTAPADDVVFIWESVERATGYKVDYWGGNLASPVKSGLIKEPIWNVGVLPASTNPYLWRVKSWSELGESSWSTITPFYVQEITVQASTDWCNGNTYWQVDSNETPLDPGCAVGGGSGDYVAKDGTAVITTTLWSEVSSFSANNFTSLMFAPIEAEPTPTPTATSAPSGVELLSAPWHLTPNGGADEEYTSVDPNVLMGASTLRVTYNLHGACVLGNDASAIIFDQNGWNYISLSNYGQNCLDGVQTVDIPLTDFGLNLSQSVGTFHTRFWYGSAIVVDITSAVVLSGSSTPVPTNTPQPPTGTPLPTATPTSIPNPTATPTPTVTPIPGDTARYNFENGTVQGFSGAGGIISGVSNSASYSFLGNNSLCANVNFPGGGWSSGMVFVSDTNVQNDKTMTVRLFVPTGVNGVSSTIYMQDQGWGWHESGRVDLVPGQWTTLTWDMSSQSFSYSNRIGLHLGNNNAYTGCVYVDSWEVN